jgi:hypothetical protein
VRALGNQNVEASINKNKFRLKQYFITYNNKKYKLTSCDFREANVSIKSVDSIFVAWTPRGYRPSISPLKSDPVQAYCL